jgi:hypothetical protein
MSAPKYILWLVTKAHDYHYPVIMSHNAKPCLNEPVRRKASLRQSMERFLDAAYKGSEQVEIREITEAAFREKYPEFPVNAGPKKKLKFEPGAKVTVDAGVWGKCQATVFDKVAKRNLYILTITKGPHKGRTGSFDPKHITAR